LKVNPLPAAKILSNTLVCEDDTLHFTAENAGIGASYEWRKAGGNVVGNSQQFTVNSSQLSNSGKYILKVTLNNCVNYDTIEVTVKKRPIFTLSSNSPVCEGDTLQFFATGAPAGTAFVWSGPQQFVAIDSVTIRPKATLGMAGLYHLTATLNGCIFADTIRAAIKSLPDVDAVSNSPVCESETLELSTTTVNNATYVWKSPTGTVISSSLQFAVNGLQLSAAGKYSVLVTLNGCENADTVNVQVKPKPTFSIDSAICAPSLKFYTVYGKSNGTVSSLQGTVVQNDTSFTVSGITIGTKAVVTFTKNNCDTTFEINSPNCQCPNISVTVNPQSQTICSGDTLQTLHAIVSTGATADWYDAPTGGNLLASGTLTFKPSSAGKLYVEARAEESGCLSTIRAVSEVIINPIPSFTASTVGTSCNGLEARNDGKLQITDIVNGRKYDFSVGSTYTGNKNYASAQSIPATGLLVDTLSNPIVSREYTVRVFDSTGCFTDRVITLLHRDCICPTPPFVVPESQSVCDGDTLRTIRGFVEPGITVDWYDEQGNLLKKGSIFFKPTQAGIYYAEARDTISGCKGLVRVPSYAFINPHPSFQAVVMRGTCNGTEVMADAKISLLDVKNGKRYDYNLGKTYAGNKTYDNATDIPADGVVLKNLANPSATVFYSFRVFDSTGCFTNSVVTFEPRICECPRPPFVVPESQAVCEGDTLRTVKGFVDSGVTVDWYDAPTGGNLLKKGSVFFKPTQGGVYYAEARDTTNNCKGTVRVPSYAFVNELPSFQLVITRGTCNGTEVLPDAKITLLELKNGKHFDYNKGKTYAGNKTYDNAAAIPTDGIVLKNLSNPATTEFYTFRIFDSTGCFTDSVVAFEPRICECPRPPFVVPESQAVCSGDTLRTVKAFVDSGITVDWYDAPTGGKLLKKADIFFKPTQAGTYYAEARDTLTNCKGTVRVPSYAFVNELPSFDLDAEKPSCLQNTAQNDGKIRVKDLKNGTKYDFSIGSIYRGNKTFSAALDIPGDSILIKEVSNPISSQTYTVRIFGEPNCFTDHTVTVSRFDCNCNPIIVSVLPLSFSACEGEPFPTLQGFVDSGVTVDWYDKDGNLLKANSLTYQPTAFGDYYAEGRSLIQNGCVSANRTKATGTKIDKPDFTLTSRPATCVGDSATSDAKILIENLKEGEKFHYSAGGTYTGNLTYENAPAIPQNGEVLTDLPNMTQIYTIRVFNHCGAFKDMTIQLTKNECSCAPSACVPLKMKMKKKKPVL